MSSEDIRVGSRWLSEISTNLEKGSFGILVLTESNLQAPWIHFEAGALAKVIGGSAVIPLLWNIPKERLQSPLSHFQAEILNKEGLKKVCEEVNSKLGEQRLDEVRLNRAFELFWKDFDECLCKVPRKQGKAVNTKERSERDILIEVLGIVRDMNRRDSEIAKSEVLSRFITKPLGFGEPGNLDDATRKSIAEITGAFNRYRESMGHKPSAIPPEDLSS